MAGRHNIRRIFVDPGRVKLGPDCVPQLDPHHSSARIAKICGIGDGLT